MKTIFDERVNQSIDKETLTEKYETTARCINEIITKIFKERREKNEITAEEEEKFKTSVPITMLKVRIEYPDYPEKTEDMSKEDYFEKVKAFFKEKELNIDEDFSEDQKKAIIEVKTNHPFRFYSLD